MSELKSAFAVYATNNTKHGKRKRPKEDKRKKAEAPVITYVKNEPLIKPKKQKQLKKHSRDVESDHEVPQLIPLPVQTHNEEKLYTTPWKDNNSVENALTILKWFLYPMTPQEFYENHWESRALHISHDDTNYFKQLLTSMDLDKMFRKHQLFFGANVDIVKYDGDKRITNNPAGSAQASLIWDAFSTGHSIRILNPQSYNKRVWKTVATLQEHFGTMVGCNAYLTPAGSQGFAPHYDDIEAFVIQLEGKKHWKLYSPKNKNDILPRYSSVDFKREDLGELEIEVTLCAGDFLYFPRGFVHEARTDDEHHSLHLTISTYQKTSYADLLEHAIPEALKTAAHSDLQFRKGLPIGYLKHLGAINSDTKSYERQKMITTVQTLIGKLADYIPAIDHGADELGRKFMHDAVRPVLSLSEKGCSSRLDGCSYNNGKAQNCSELDPDTEIRLVRSYGMHLVVSPGDATLYYCTQNSKVYHGNEEQYLSISLDLCPIIECLLHKFPGFVSIESLPHPDMSAKINLMTELWDYGIIVTKEPLPIEDDEQDPICPE